MENNHLVAFLLTVCLCKLLLVECVNDTGWFWQVTDFHYDANYSIHGNPSSMCHLSNGSAYKNGIYGNYLCDAPWKLVESAINEMKSQNATPDFILWTGDSVPHVKETELSLAKVYENIRKVSDRLRDVFPNTSIYPVLGNHDPYPSNQMSPSSEQYYEGILNSSHWDSLLGDSEQSNFVKGGYYSSVTKYGLRILGLNTNLYYGMNSLTKMLWDPADQFEWMWDQLLDARQKSQHVYIVSHVAPGAFERMANMTWFYPEHNKRYLSILQEFSDHIAAQIYGHDHTDSFRILYKTGSPVNSLFLSPAVTPWKSTLPGVGANNPSLRLYKYDRSTGAVLDYIQYFVNLTAANMENQTDWQVEYQATTDYHVPDLSPKSLHKLLMSFQNHSNGYWEKYLKYNSVGYDIDPSCDEHCARAQICAMQHLNFQEYDICIENKHPSTTEFPSTTHKSHHPKHVPKYMYYVIGSLAVVVVVSFVVITLLCISRRRHIAPYRRFSTSLNA